MAARKKPLHPIRIEEMREKIRAVMRWAGPRMLPVHPVLSIRHAAVTLRSKREAKKAG